jgi:hypothetical protein
MNSIEADEICQSLIGLSLHDRVTIVRCITQRYHHAALFKSIQDFFIPITSVGEIVHYPGRVVFDLDNNFVNSFGIPKWLSRHS